MKTPPHHLGSDIRRDPRSGSSPDITSAVRGFTQTRKRMMRRSDNKDLRNKSTGNKRMLTLAVMLAVIFAAAVLITALITKNVTEKKAAERLEAAGQTEATLDKYSMQKYCADNAQAVFKALKDGDSKALKKLMIDPEGIEAVMEFADWTAADFESAISMGSGSLTAEPDDKGRMDESERFFVDVGDSRYVFFIETLTSDHGRKNDGVSAVSVTSYEHFDETDYEWNGEGDEQSALAGELYWNK